MKLKTTFALFLAFMMCSASPAVIAEEVSAAEVPIATILYTNDVHNAYTRSDDAGQMGYAAVAAYKAGLEAAGHTVTLVDCGDSIQGGAIGMLSEGSYIAAIMDEVGYSFAVPGNHEFDFGVDNFLEIAEIYDYEYLCCNFVDLRTGEPVFDAYEIVSYGETDVAYIGVTTPESLTKYFRNADGEYIYSFCEDGGGAELYAAVQNAVNDAKAEGADYVVVLSHLGTDIGSEPWRAYDVIANTAGIDVVLDAHSHSVIEQEMVENKDGEAVILSSSGTKLANLGVLTIDEHGVKTALVSGLSEEDAAVAAYIAGITGQFDELLFKVVAESEILLTTENPETGERLVRSRETNLGNFCADAYRILLGTDIAFVNGGGVRANIEVGEITYEEIIAVHPFGNELCVAEVTGQQIADALEHSVRFAGEGESGGFLQVSGITCTIDTAIPSSVVTDDMEMFVEAAGERRVRDIRINGKMLDPEGIYTLASNDYLLKECGGGYSMFEGANILPDCGMLDSQALIDYITDVLDGILTADSIYADYRGDGRLRMLEPEDSAIDSSASEKESGLPAPNIRYFTYLVNGRH